MEVSVKPSPSKIFEARYSAVDAPIASLHSNPVKEI